MWGFGCVLYEIVRYTLRDEFMTDEEFAIRRYLFPGASCFPLSENYQMRIGPSGAPQLQVKNEPDDNDQLKVILESMGP